MILGLTVKIKADCDYQNESIYAVLDACTFLFCEINLSYNITFNCMRPRHGVEAKEVMMLTCSSSASVSSDSPRQHCISTL